MSAPYAAALRSVLAPLRYAVRNNFAQLGRIVDLEQTVIKALVRATENVAHNEQKTLAEVVRQTQQVSTDNEPRKKQLQVLLALIETLLAKETSLGAGATPSSSPKAHIPASAPRSTAQPQTAVAHPLSCDKAAIGAKVEHARVDLPALDKAFDGTQKTGRKQGRFATQLMPDSPLSDVRGVGPRLAQQLATRQLHTVADLLRFLPRRYQGRAGHQAIGRLASEAVVVVEGVIQAIADRFVRGRHTLEVVLADETGSVTLMWFRVPGKHFVSQFIRGNRMRAAGTVKRFRARMQIAHPEISMVRDAGAVTFAEPAASQPDDAIVPIYLEVEGVHPSTLRRLIDQVLPVADRLKDPLPQGLVKKRQLALLGQALRWVHQPPQDTDVSALADMSTPWHQRLIYDELFFVQLGLFAQRQRAQTHERGPTINLPVSLDQEATEILPFTPTDAQKRVLKEIGRDLSSGRPMQRLLQGDVGAGKTAVALIAAISVARAGYQVAMMAPTELLAEQHARTTSALLTPLGLRCALLTGNVATKAKRELLAELATGALQVVVGTHALVQEKVRFGRLALAIIDEQHRFGVAQRARLSELGRQGTKASPHMLVMTATPIPRTLALTAYGDLDLSIIDALPPGRRPVTTRLFRDGQRAQVFAEVVAQVAQGRQAYVVFPLVEESDKEGMSEIRAATSSIEELSQGPLKGLRLGLLHGKLGADEKEAVMQAFLRRDMDVLVATTVIEVGIDVPNATVMVIEHAERFGLSQLHQLRGRVGRGAHQSSCLLVARARPSHDAWRRLTLMTETTDGFRVAEEDLAIRGPGDFLGTRQSGMPVLSLANLARDGRILAQARDDARALVQDPPGLDDASLSDLRSALTHLGTQGLKWLQVG